MRYSVYHQDELIPHATWDRILEDIAYAFSPEYICNDTKWFKVESGKAKPCVVNQAEYISLNFQSRLHDRGWAVEKVLDGQRIDAYKDLAYVGNYVRMTADGLKEAISALDPARPDYIAVISKQYYSSYLRQLPSAEMQNVQPGLTVGNGELQLRVGLEFEVGNIASSFRAISKLNFLYEANHIDLGVFVTCLDRQDSTRIWPQSNRNGSITELEQRRFLTQIKFPSLVIGFAPDGYSRTAPYVNRAGQTYSIPESEEVVDIQGRRYRYSEDHQMVTPA